MHLFSTPQISRQNFFSFLIALIPFSFIAGNMIININILILIFSSFYFFGKNIFKIRYYYLDKFIFSFFLLVLFTGIINDYKFYIEEIAWKGYWTTVIKSIFFFKYFLLYLILRYLIENKLVNLKIFFISCFAASIFVSFDIFFQFIFGQDIFGYKDFTLGRKLSGPFGDELIAGSYLQRFSVFSFFLIPFFYQEKFKYLLKFLVPFLFIVYSLAIILSGNRMPFLLFILLVFLILLFQKQTRKFLIPSLVSILIIFYALFNINISVKNNFQNFYNQIVGMSQVLINKDTESKKSSQYLKEFSTFYHTWAMNKYIGGGIKNFRYYCHMRPNINLEKSNGFVCNMHPHNYYLEILTEVGLAGFVIVSIIFLITLYISFFKKYFSKKNLNNNLIIPFMFLYLIEIFPLKSTGSFFTTGNTTYLFFIMGILIGLIRHENLFEK